MSDPKQSLEYRASLSRAHTRALDSVDQCVSDTLSAVDRVSSERDAADASAADEAPVVHALEDEVHHLRDLLRGVSVAGSAETYAHLSAERTVLMRQVIASGDAYKRVADRVATERYLVGLDGRLLAYEAVAARLVSS